MSNEVPALIEVSWINKKSKLIFRFSLIVLLLHCSRKGVLKLAVDGFNNPNTNRTS